MKTVTRILCALAFAGCGEFEGQAGFDEGTAGAGTQEIEFDQSARVCTDYGLQLGSRNWLRQQYPAITYCSGIVSDVVWNCTGQGGRTWKVTRTYNSPGAQVKRKVEPSQSATRNYKCASSVGGDACGVSCAWY